MRCPTCGQTVKAAPKKKAPVVHAMHDFGDRPRCNVAARGWEFEKLIDKLMRGETDRAAVLAAYEGVVALRAYSAVTVDPRLVTCGSCLRVLRRLEKERFKNA